MVLRAQREPLAELELDDPDPGRGELLVRVAACGVCRTDLHVVDGDLPDPRLPLVPGHQVVGTVAALGERCERFAVGDRVGIPWLGRTCGRCRYCAEGRENLCDAAVFTGYGRDGGYAELSIADERFCLRPPDAYADAEAAPLLCAGLIGLRALRRAGDPGLVGLYGFGASAHLVCQLAVWEGRRVFAFTSPGDAPKQDFARSLGAAWAGASDEHPPEVLDAAIVFAPVGALVPRALSAVRKGGVVVCAGIHMSAIPSLRYEVLWGERSLTSVANLTRGDGEEFMRIAASVRLRSEVELHPLAAANAALDRLRAGELRAAAVLVNE
jgi:propanol-preferring alcohol dehydrogenase